MRLLENFVRLDFSPALIISIRTVKRIEKEVKLYSEETTTGT